MNSMWLHEEENVHRVRNKSLISIKCDCMNMKMYIEFEINNLSVFNEIARGGKLTLGLKLKWLVSIQWDCMKMTMS